MAWLFCQFNISGVFNVVSVNKSDICSDFLAAFVCIVDVVDVFVLVGIVFYLINLM